MAKQEVIYKNAGDTGEREGIDGIESIEPVASGERVGQTVLRRPVENLRHRTEVDRTELELQKYLQDSDMRWVIAGGAADGSAVGSVIPYIDWDPVAGIFTITANIVVQPLSTPAADVQDSLVYNFDDGINTGSVTISPEPTERSYNGANRLEVIWDDSKTPAELPLGAEAVLSGDPLHILTIYVKNDGTSTVGQVAAALALILPASGFQYTTGGNAATQIPGINPLPADEIMDGTFERELHVIDPVTLANYFATPAPLADGDTLAIWYDEITEADPSTDGRRQSCATNLNTVLPVGQLTNLTTHPERIPIAIPLCKRIGDDLLFIDGTVVAGALPASPVSTPFGAHGYVLDLIYGGGVFDDTLYAPWMGVGAASFQDAWDNMIPIFEPGTGTGAAARLSFDDTALTALAYAASPSLQDAVDALATDLAFAPAPASLFPLCGASKVGFDGATIPGVVTGMPFDMWYQLLSPDVWTALYNMMDAYASTSALPQDGASLLGVRVNASPGGASVDQWGIPGNTLRQVLLDLQVFINDKASVNEDETGVTGDWTVSGDWLVPGDWTITGDWLFEGDTRFIGSVMDVGSHATYAQYWGMSRHLYGRFGGKGTVPSLVSMANLSLEGNLIKLGGTLEAVDLDVSIVDGYSTPDHPYNEQPMVCVLANDGASPGTTYVAKALAHAGALVTVGIDDVSYGGGVTALGIATNSYGAAIMYDNGVLRFWKGVDHLFDGTYTDIATGMTPGTYNKIQTLASTGTTLQLYAVAWGGENTGSTPLGLLNTLAPGYTSFPNGGVPSSASCYFDGGMTIDQENIYVSFFDPGGGGYIGAVNHNTGLDAWTTPPTRHNLPTPSPPLDIYRCHSMATDGRKVWYMLTTQSGGGLNVMLGVGSALLSADPGGPALGTWVDNAYDYGTDITEGQNPTLEIVFDGFNMWAGSYRYDGIGPAFAPSLLQFPAANACLWDPITLTAADRRRGLTIWADVTAVPSVALSMGPMVFDGTNVWGISIPAGQNLHRIMYSQWRSSLFGS